MATDSVREPEPMRGYNFELELGSYQGKFTRCSGLGVRVHPILFREGGGGANVRQLAGPVEFSEVTLWYGVIPSVHAGLWDWLLTAMKGTPEYRSVSLHFLDNAKNRKMTYNLYGTWPSAWQAPNLEGLGRDIAIESLTLVFERLEKG